MRPIYLTGMTLPPNERSSWISHIGYGGALLLALGLFQLGLWLELPAPQASLGAVFLVGALLLVVERLMPHSERWKPTWGTVGIDVLHNIVTAALVAPLVRAVVFALLDDGVPPPSDPAIVLRPPRA